MRYDNLNYDVFFKIKKQHNYFFRYKSLFFKKITTFLNSKPTNIKLNVLMHNDCKKLNFSEIINPLRRNTSKFIQSRYLTKKNLKFIKADKQSQKRTYKTVKGILKLRKNYNILLATTLMKTTSLHFLNKFVVLTLVLKGFEFEKIPYRSLKNFNDNVYGDNKNLLLFSQINFYKTINFSDMLIRSTLLTPTKTNTHGAYSYRKLKQTYKTTFQDLFKVVTHPIKIFFSKKSSTTKSSQNVFLNKPKNKHRVNFFLKKITIYSLSKPQTHEKKYCSTSAENRVSRYFKNFKNIFFNKVNSHEVFFLPHCSLVINDSINRELKLIYSSNGNNILILMNVGLFITTKFNFLKIFFSMFSDGFIFKKNYFSFLIPNQLKKEVFLRKKRMLISRYFFLQKKMEINIPNQPLQTRNIFLKFNDFFEQSFFKKNFTNNQIDYFFTDPMCDLTFYYNDLDEMNDESLKYGEVLLPRIRFKPGYQRIWRRARTTIKEALKIKFRYQYRLTRYLTRFSSQIKNYYLYFSELTLEATVMHAKLLPDINSFNMFLEDKLIFVNGFYVINSKHVVKTNDVVQMLVSQWYYIFYRWLSNWTALRTKKFKKLVFKKNRALSYKITKLKKQKSKYTPNWIFNVRYDFNDVRPYLEVDYFTLSVFFIFEPYLINIYPVYDLPINRTNIFRLYNWKYIN